MQIRLGPVSLTVHDGFFHLPSGGPRDFNRRNLYMFGQDLALRTAPYSSRSAQGRTPVFAFEPDEGHEVPAIDSLSGMFPDRHMHRRPVDAVTAVIRHLAERLPWTGRVVTDLRPTQRGRHRQHGTRECTDRRVVKLGGYFLQVGSLFRNRALELHVGMVHEGHTLEIRIPRKLGGVWKYRRLLRKLDRFDAIGPRQWQEALEQGRPESQIDLSRYRRLVSAYRDSIARQWGWAGRDTSSIHCTEFFIIYRHLRFLCACALIRQGIVEAITAAWRRRGISARVTVSGLPAASEIEAVIEKLKSGELSIGGALKAVGDA